MADTKLSALTALAAGPAETDEIYIRDISESTADESKRITAVELLNPENFTELSATPAATDELFINDGGVGKKITVANLLTETSGVWTPTIEDDSDTNDEAGGYSTQTGRYLKRGRLVYISFEVRLDGVGTLTTSQQCRIGGIPFTASSDQVGGHIGIADAAGLAINVDESCVGFIDGGGTAILMSFWGATNGPDTFTIDMLSADGRLEGSGFYEWA